MKRVGNAQTIADIEFVIDPPVLSERRHSWTAWEVDCTRDLHRYSGQAHEFNIQVVDLRHNKAGRISWRALIITESWKADGERGEIRNSKWLKVLDGKTSDIKAWMRRCRSQKVNSTMGLQLSEL
jgi:hypothetical protein